MRSRDTEHAIVVVIKIHWSCVMKILDVLSE